MRFTLQDSVITFLCLALTTQGQVVNCPDKNGAAIDATVNYCNYGGATSNVKCAANPCAPKLVRGKTNFDLLNHFCSTPGDFAPC
ncbi:hypothetical protein LZ30DRAFT_716707 [Colletotrichum cereale]|nr:hypothetical protein LZ30DRAFT_716707 [Colletotrichum cereale]